MAQDKFSAVWVSHSSISDYLACPRSYYLKHIYKDPKTNHKIKVTAPALSLGQAVHEVVESLSVLPVDRRFANSLIAQFDTTWEKVSGKKGGFRDTTIEQAYKNRGKEMLLRLTKNPGPLKNHAVKIRMNLPYFWLSDDDNIILCGKIDWLEYVPETDSVHIIDFKTGKRDEDPKSLQLPIYHLLVSNCQKRKATKASYWYIERSDTLDEKMLPDLELSKQDILKIAKEMKLARQLSRFRCPHQNGCFACRPYEAIVKGVAEFVGLDELQKDMYIVDDTSESLPDSDIL
jgi:hypothetical protein